MMCRILASLVLFSCSLSAVSQTFEPRCGDCWCVPEGGTDSGTCPGTEGIYQSFPDSYPEMYQTFTLTSTPITLQAEDGTACFPFLDSIGALNYAESQLPACVPPDSSTTTGFCGYKYAEAATDASDCPNREYEMNDYASEEEVAADGAIAIHSGPCGVCSDAQDLAVRMSTMDSLQSKSITCGTQFVFGGTFSGLVDCYETIGFTTPCATLWAHFAASNTELCAGDCAGQITLNGDPPLCELGSCLSCAADFEAEFNDLAGLKKSPYNAGFNVDIAYPCDLYTRIESFDPCFSGPAKETTSPAPTSTPPPTATPTKVTSETPTDQSTSLTTSLGITTLALALLVALF